MACTKAPTKEDFDWLRCEMTGFMRTQILAVAASLRLAEHLQDGGRTAEELAAASGIERSMAFRFLRAWRLKRPEITNYELFLKQIICRRPAFRHQP